MSADAISISDDNTKVPALCDCAFMAAILQMFWTEILRESTKAYAHVMREQRKGNRGKRGRLRGLIARSRTSYKRKARNMCKKRGMSFQGTVLSWSSRDHDVDDSRSGDHCHVLLSVVSVKQRPTPFIKVASVGYLCHLARAEAFRS